MKYKKGDFVIAKIIVKTKYQKDVCSAEVVLHTPPNDWKTKKVLVSLEIKPTLYLVVGQKKIQTGYYYYAVMPNSNWTGSNESEPAIFAPDKYHHVYILEQADTAAWRTLEYALENDLEDARY